MDILNWIFKDSNKDTSKQVSRSVSELSSSHSISKPDLETTSSLKKVTIETVKQGDHPSEQKFTEGNITHDSRRERGAEKEQNKRTELFRSSTVQNMFHMNPYSPWADDSEIPYWEHSDQRDSDEDLDFSRSKGHTVSSLEELEKSDSGGDSRSFGI
jgi:hypothetical protein